MSITGLARDLQDPCMVRMYSSDNLAAVAASNYIKNQIPNTTALNHGLWQWNVGDLVAVSASDGDQIFRFSGSDFTTLVNLPSTGGGSGTVTVTGGSPVTGHFANFSGVTSITDHGYVPTNAAKTKVVMADSATTSGHIAAFSDIAGTIKDDGYVPSDPAKTNIVMASGATVAGNIAAFADTAGTLTDSGYVPSDPSKTVIAMVDESTAPVIADVALFKDILGTIGNNVSGDAVNRFGGFQAGTLSPPVGGGFTSFAQGTQGSFEFTAEANFVSGIAIVLTHTFHAQNTTYRIPDCQFADGHILNKSNASPFVSGNLLSATSPDGVVVDSGIVAATVQSSANIKAAQSADIGGGGAGPLVVSVPGLTSASVVNATVLSSSNPVSVIACVAGTDQFSITFSADPGVSAIVNYAAFVAPQ